MSQILFYTGTKAQFDALTTKNENALYFLTDANRLYKGSTPFTHPVQAVSAFPASGEAGTILDTCRFCPKTGVACYCCRCGCATKIKRRSPLWTPPSLLYLGFSVLPPS